MSWRRVFRSRKFSSKEVSALNAVDGEIRDGESVDGNDWSTILPELLREIIRRVDADEEQWPHRQNVVACAGVCKRWRDMTREIVRSPSHNDIITFPSCLKKPGPCELPHQCLIKRDKKTSTFYLYLALTQSFKDKGKFLLAARRYRFGSYTEDVISLDADDFSQGSNAYVGKLSSDFLGINFTIYDSQPPHCGVKPSSGRASRRFASKKRSPQVPARNFAVGHVAYKHNLRKYGVPRRMVCSLKSPISSKGESSDIKSLDGHKMHSIDLPASGYTMFKNKAPRWHENFQRWVLNFHGRVKIASVKNFQLVATVDQSQPGEKGDEEIVLLQFGKVGDDTFTMDYREPLSAFQAFAICLTTFGTKLANFA